MSVCRKVRKLEGWKVRRLEGWKVGKGWKVRKLEFLHNSTNSCTIPPSRAPQARGEACVTVFERRSHIGLPAECRPGPSERKTLNLCINGKAEEFKF